MRIGEANYENYSSYIELFENMNNNKQDKSVKINKNAHNEQPFIELPYRREMSGWYNGNTIEDLLTGHLKNSYGVEGMDITGKQNWQKIVDVSDKMKGLVLNEVKRSFYKYNGMCGDNMTELDSYNYYINEYLKTLDVKDRLPTSYTIQQMECDLSKRVSDEVKAKVFGWSAGKPIPSGVLDEIFSDDSIVGEFKGNDGWLKGIDATV